MKKFPFTLEMHSRFSVTFLLVLAGAAFLGCRAARPPIANWTATESSSAERVPRYEIQELTIQHNGIYENNFFDVELTAVFLTSDGKQHAVRGFYYGGDQWKVRFRPDEVGKWRYTYKLSGKSGFSKEGGGAFECLPSEEEGPVRRDPQNPFAWEFASGRPYFPIGIQDCATLDKGKLRDLPIDGERRSDPPKMISWDGYLSLYGEAGFNLLRFSQRNCSYSLMSDLDEYLVAESLATDELLSLARKHGFRVMFGFFGYHGQNASGNRVMRVLKRSVFPIFGVRQEAVMDPNDNVTISKEERFIDYCVARWGVYADFWELLNERKASDAWTTQIADHVRSVDPDRKPISTSWEKPNVAAIDINSPHWYQAEDELNSDLVVAEKAAKWKQPEKPVIVGEHGNDGMNWDPRSAARMRIRLWASLFEEISLVFWNTSWSKFGVNQGRYTLGTAANIYLGPEERGYVRALRDFESRLEAGMRMSPVKVSSPLLVRGYGLGGNSRFAAYLQHAANHTSDAENVEITLDIPRASGRHFTVEWFDPASGKTLSRQSFAPGSLKLKAPPFKVDIALLIQGIGI
jgi:hypothetical protein